MKEILNIVTPVSRLWHLSRIAESIEPLTTELDVRWFVMLDQPNLWGNHSRNRALRSMEPVGWIYFLDDDNIMHEGFIDAFHAVAKSGHPVGLLCQEDKFHNNRNNPWGYHTVGQVDTGNLLVHASIGVYEQWPEAEYGADWHYINACIKAAMDDKFPFITPIRGCYYNYLRDDHPLNYVPRGGIVIECGAHRGEDTVRLAALAKHVYAFEPDPRNIPVLMKTVKEPVGWHVLHDGSAAPFDNITVIPKAVSNRIEEREWFESSSSQSSSLLPATEHHLRVYPHVTFAGYQGNKVQCTTLDSFNFPQVDFIWCDVQGATRLLIDGARKTLERTRYFFCEVDSVPYYKGEPTRGELLDLLGKDWTIRAQWDKDALYENRRLSKTPLPRVEIMNAPLDIGCALGKIHGWTGRVCWDCRK